MGIPNLLKYLRETIWPIKSSELPLFLPLAGVMFCFLSNFSALRSLKDSLVIPILGAEIISFLKLWFIFPSGILFTVLYVKMSNSFNLKQIYLIILGTFSALFLLFGFVLFPAMDTSNLDIMGLGAKFPYFRRLISIFAAWPLSLLYVIGDLWSSIMINLMFWQLANLTTNGDTARRFYPTFGIVGNLGLIVSGNLLVTLSSEGPSQISDTFRMLMSTPARDEDQFVQIICLFIVTLNIVSIFFVSTISNKVQAHSGEIKVDQLKQKTSLSLKESIKLVFHSKILLYIAVMVVCYTIVITLTEGPWKDQLRLLYPSPKAYLGFMGEFNIWLGVSAILFVMLTNLLLNRFSWLAAALFSPIVMGVTGIAFFLFIIFRDSLASTMINPLFAAVMVGAFQNIASKSSKYSIFDTSKEIVYVPLSLEIKSKGKAAVEIIGSKLGKMIGSFIQVLIFTDSSIVYADIYVYLLLAFIPVISSWLYTVFKLDNELKAMYGTEEVLFKKPIKKLSG